MPLPNDTTTTIFFSPASNSNKKEYTDWEATTVIDPAYIDQLKEKMKNIYIVPRSSYERPQFHEEDLKRAYVKNTKKNATYQRHNPFSLRLPWLLEGYESLYVHTWIRDYSGSKLTGLDAKKTYFNFLREYNFAYITYLEAINRSDQAVTKMKELFSSNRMFEAAEIKLDFLNAYINERRPDFLLALLAYLSLNIVFSPDEHISTAARVRALEFLQGHFDIDKTATALSFYGFYSGYRICRHSKNEFGYNLLPKSFISKPNEIDADQNDIFLENNKIKEIFQIENNKYRLEPSYDLDLGFSRLINKYPLEALQVLHSLLRLREGTSPVADRISEATDIKRIFIQVAEMVKLDPFQKGDIFGSAASYRNNGESKPGLSARAAWSMGHEAYGEEIAYSKELERLSKSELIRRILLLERENVETRGQLNRNHCTRDNDPKGYFAILQLSPDDTTKDDFKILLTRHYRALSLIYHPDKGGTAEQFRKLEEAYKFLSDPAQRHAYQTQRNESTNSSRP